MRKARKILVAIVVLSATIMGQKITPERKQASPEQIFVSSDKTFEFTVPTT